MQDYYMAMHEKRYDVFKEIGNGWMLFFMLWKEFQYYHFFMNAHYEEFKDSSGDTIFRFKTVGLKMTNDYITPEGNLILFFYLGNKLMMSKIRKLVKEVCCQINYFWW